MGCRTDERPPGKSVVEFRFVDGSQGHEIGTGPLLFVDSGTAGTLSGVFDGSQRTNDVAPDRMTRSGRFPEVVLVIPCVSHRETHQGLARQNDCDRSHSVDD
jgi:hypothetical protein